MVTSSEIIVLCSVVRAVLMPVETIVKIAGFFGCFN